MDPKADCETNLLLDEPTTDDAFGPHARIAGAVVRLVEHEPRGFAIGLEGRYGSGKTTVVNLVRQTLETSPDRAVLVFNAWAHAGDPLRRTFLETLVRSLKERGWLEANA